MVGQQNGIVERSLGDRDRRRRAARPVPAERPQREPPADDGQALAAALRPVASRTDTSQDVNNQYGQASRRLADAQALRTSLLKQLANATTTEQIDSLNAQIRDAERAISRDEASLRRAQPPDRLQPGLVTINARPCRR